jgi:hypothetical protein
MHDPLSEIEAECAACGLDLRKVLAAAGVAPSTWWRWKNDKFEPRTRTLRAISEEIARGKQQSAA